MDLYISRPQTLSDAVRYGSVPFVKKLLRDGADASACTEEGIPVLWLAVMENQSEIIRLLVEAGAELDVTNEDGMTALMMAALKQKNEAAQILIEAGANRFLTDHPGNSVAHYLAFGGNTDLLNFFRNLADFSPDFFSTTNHNQKTPFVLAAEEGQAAFLASLLEIPGFFISQDDILKSLCLAAYGGREKAVEFLLSRKADPSLCDEQGKAAVHYACLGGHIKILSRLFVEKPSCVNTKDRWGNTPLHYAAATANGELYEYLLSQNADTEAKNSEQMTAEALFP